MSNENQFEAKWREIIARSWTDESFKKDLIEDPNKVIAGEGINIPSGINFVVVENEPNRMHLVLPSKDAGEAVNDDGSSLSYYNAAIY